MRPISTRVAFLLAALVLLSVVTGCRTTPAASAPNHEGPAAAASEDATGQARAALQRLFDAWGSKDAPAAEAAIVPDRRGGEWEFADVEKVQFGPIADGPSDVPGYMYYGRGGGVLGADEVRAFRATITYSYKPGREGVMQDGTPAPYMWFLERQAGGEWLVSDWGY